MGHPETKQEKSLQVQAMRNLPCLGSFWAPGNSLLGALLLSLGHFTFTGR